MPRLICLPGSHKPDTRLLCKSYDSLTGTDSSIGPGSYSTELTRFRSANLNYSYAPVYHSLASDKDGFTPPDIVQSSVSMPNSPNSMRMTTLKVMSPRRCSGSMGKASPVGAGGGGGEGEEAGRGGFEVGEPGWGGGSPTKLGTTVTMTTTGSAMASSVAGYPTRPKPNKFGQL